MKLKKKEREARLDAFFTTLTSELESVTTTSPEIRFAVDRLVARARKKARYHVPTLKSKAIASFKETNDVARTTAVTLSPSDVANARHFLTVVFERFASRINSDNIQIALDHEHLMSCWRFGPGSSNGITGTHAADKISQKMPATSRAAPYVRSLRRSNFYFSQEDMVEDCVPEIYGSRLSTVHKNQETMRTIAIEPPGNMAMQLAAGRYLEDVLRSIGLDIRTQQEFNKLMARSGSIHGSFATIDLKSASDLIILELVRLLFPSAWFKLFSELRSEVMKLPTGETIDLHMMSTMGNGFTFPMMTLLLVSLIYAVRARKDSNPTLWVDWSKTAVFGDDIIVPTEEFADVCEVLEQAGLIVNHDKSFGDGPFRESCGGDYWNGYNVTPFYVTSLGSDAEVFVAINQVLEWCGSNKILLHHTIRLLKGYVDTIYLVPEWHSDDAGVRSAYMPKRKYKYLRVKQVKRYLKSDKFALMLACGGYINSGAFQPGSYDGQPPYYVPRPLKTKHKVKSARLPQGYLDGRDPITRDPAVSDYLVHYVPLLFNK